MFENILNEGFSWLQKLSCKHFLFKYLRKEEASYIWKYYSDIFFAYYRSNRLRGYDIKTSIERASGGYGCPIGWRAEPVGKVTLLHYLL